MILIAVESLYSIKMYDNTILNPLNYQIIAMCQFGLLYFPKSLPLHTWLLKLYSKLGLTSMITKQNESFPTEALGGDKEVPGSNKLYERIGAIRYQAFADFGAHEQLDELVHEFSEHYIAELKENKS